MRTPDQDLKVVLGMLAAVAAPAALTLWSVRVPVRPAYATGSDPSPLGYTASLSLFAVPIAVILWWFLRRERFWIERRAFSWSLAFTATIGFALDLFFAHTFFDFPNPRATIGWWVPGLDWQRGWVARIPVEEFAFYLLGFAAILLVYTWANVYWMGAYSADSMHQHAAATRQLVRPHYKSGLWAVVALVAALLFKYTAPGVDHGGYPGYLTYLLLVAAFPSLCLFRAVKPVVNWRAFGFTTSFILLVSLLWEATLAIPYGWWSYRPAAMLGVFVGPWGGLPVEAVLVWVASSWGAIIVYEAIRLGQHMGRPPLEAAFGPRPVRGSSARTPRAAAAFVALLGAATLLGAPAHAGRIFRPLIADPRENQFRMKWVNTTEDWRYGTDITDSLSQGGFETRQTTMWDVGFGETFLADPWFGVPGHHIPGVPAYQMGIPAGVFANFDRGGAELTNADYQFGLSADLLLRGGLDSLDELTGFDHPVWTLRVMGYHRSTHVGDEYLSQGAFGRNQSGLPDSGLVFDRPPVRRYNLSFEALRCILSGEGEAPWLFPGTLGGHATARGYAGFEKKFGRLFTHEPANFHSAIYQAGLELRTQGNAKELRRGWFTRVENWIYPKDHPVDTEWLAAIDFKLAKPYEFAFADALPGATTEAWTPHLWSNGGNGREMRRYAGSWHAMIGIATYKRSDRRITGAATVSSRPTHPHGSYLPQEAVLALDWYRGYSPNGQFQDQRLRYGPTWMPSLTVHF